MCLEWERPRRQGERGWQDQITPSHGKTLDFISSAKGNPWRDLTEEWHDLIDNLKACSNCHAAKAKELQGGKKGRDRAGSYCGCSSKMWWWLNPGWWWWRLRKYFRSRADKTSMDGCGVDGKKINKKWLLVWGGLVYSSACDEYCRILSRHGFCF